MAQYVTPTYVKEDMPEKDGNNFFVRLAYGYVEHRLGMNTKEMTTRQVIQEFLEAYGASSPADFFKKKFKKNQDNKQDDEPQGKADETKVEETKTEETEQTAEGKVIVDELSANNVSYNEVKRYNTQPSQDEIISRLAGGDITRGSCSSLAFAYMGNLIGYDVLDFRDGNSRSYFAKEINIEKMASLPGVDGNVYREKYELRGTMRIIKSLEIGEEYYLSTGKHAAMVRRTENGAEYLELQSRTKNGWKSFNEYGNMEDTLYHRFGCRKSAQTIGWGDYKRTYERPVVVINAKSMKNSKDFAKILGYINTNESEQKKGATGGIR